MNPTIAQMLIQCRHQDIEAEAAHTRLVASSKPASRTASASNGTTARKLVVVLVGLLAAVAH